MSILGEACLLICLIATGYAAFLAVLPSSRGDVRRQRATALIGSAGFGALTVIVALLIWALVTRDYRYEYVTQYASRLLPWHYCVSALWVGQAGSLLLWAWMTAALALALRVLPAADADLRSTAFGLTMCIVCFLVGVMAFAADPMAPSRNVANEGEGLSPLLQHPSMLIHPPIVFLAYAAWGMPCALAFAALLHGRLDATWTQMARSWALFAWALMSAGLLLGAHWAYQELGWGGYWSWDPVENGSLLPWLTGTALIHSLMAWRLRQQLKKTATTLAILTFAMCNFATFLTRSGVFSSVHAFSESPIGWMFLGLMSALVIGAAVLPAWRRDALAAKNPLRSFLSREALIAASVYLLLLLTLVVLIGTLVAPVSMMLLGRAIQIGPPFYNNVLLPIGLMLLAMTAIAPLVQWGAPPTPAARRLLLICVAASLLVMLLALIVGLRHPLALAVSGLAALSVTALAAPWMQDAWRRQSPARGRRPIDVLRVGRRKYAAYAIHLGFVCLAVGVTGSSVGSEHHEVTLAEGDAIDWAGRHILYRRLEQEELPDKLAATAVLQIMRDGAPPVELRPARHLHLLQDQWTTEAAIHSTWGGDFYAVLNAGLGDGRVALTLISNPMICWIWAGGAVATVGSIVAMWPSRNRRQAIGRSPVNVIAVTLTSNDEDRKTSAA